MYKIVYIYMYAKNLDLYVIFPKAVFSCLEFEIKERC